MSITTPIQSAPFRPKLLSEKLQVQEFAEPEIDKRPASPTLSQPMMQQDTFGKSESPNINTDNVDRVASLDTFQSDKSPTLAASSSNQTLPEQEKTGFQIATDVSEERALSDKPVSTWMKVLDDMLADVTEEQETVNGIPVAELIYMREKMRRAAKPSVSNIGGKQPELNPCPLPGMPSRPWALLDRDTVGSDHPDSKRFWEIINGKNTPKDMLDKISKRQVKIGPKGQISFPAPHIKRPKVWWGQPGSQQSKKGQQGQNGQGQPSQGIGSYPGKKPGDIIGKRPANGNGQGDGGEGGEGEGDYPKELWTPPVPRSQVAKLLQGEWGLPFIEPRGKGKMNQFIEHWDMTTTTPPNLIERQPTLKNAIQRSFAKAWYDKPMTLEERIQNGMHTGSPAIPVDRIVIKGNTLVPSKTLQKAVAGFQNKELSYEDLGKILTLMDKKYQAAGYASSKAIIPAQPLDSRELIVDVREVRDTFDASAIQVHPKDKVRIAARIEPKPVAKTAIFYVMDVSGSVSNDMKEMARVQNYFLDTHLMYQYGLVAANLANEKYDDKKHFGQGVVRRFIVHTDGAEETSEEDFYTTAQSGGTKISSGFKLTKEIIERDFPPKDWNIYVFYQGDGDNYRSDNDTSIQLMKDMLDMGVNMIGYTHLAPYTEGSTSSYDGLGYSGNFYHEVKKQLKDRQNVRTSVLHKPELDEYKQSIQRLLEESASGAKK
jgi:uncharacterized sporulation protein YeaH/YhbH (DUF444 family)